MCTRLYEIPLVGSPQPEDCLNQVPQEGLKHPNHVNLCSPKAILSTL